MLDTQKFFDIQRFADGGEGGDGQTQQSAPSGEDKDVPESDNKSESKNNEIDIKAEISKAIAEERKAWEAEAKKREAIRQKEIERQKENERLSKLSEEERQKAEIENSRKELELKEKELKRKELMLEMTKVLDERKIPVKFMEYLIAEDNESTLERIKTFEKEYKKAIEDAVNEKLKGKAPQAAGKINTAGAKSGFLDTILKNQAKRF